MATPMVRSVVLDTGALIAIERFDRKLWSRLTEELEFWGDIVVPASVLAEAWRGGPRSAPIARLLDSSDVDSLDEARAREVGERLASRGGRQATDAHVVCCALEIDAAVATTDAEDVEALCEGLERLAVIPL